MRNLIQAAVVTLFAASTAQAQQAVQWKVSDGGNGHWYGVMVVPGGVSWSAAKSLAEGRAGILACAESQGELAYIQSQFAPARVPQAWVPQNPWNDFTFGPWLGAYQEPSSPEPDGGWKWITGASFVPSGPYFNNDACGVPEDRLHLYYSTDGFVGLNDMPDAPVPSACGPSNPSLLIEWSADCNGDGTVDYGQCRDGTLPDYNGNNIPDCCEHGDACVVGNYPVQWRVEDGGNGHWYLPQQAASDCWDQSRLTATQLGGHLATVTSSLENQFVAGLVRRFYGSNITIGGYKDLSAGLWRWVTGEPWQYTNWQAGEPGCCAPEEWWLDMNMMTGEWRDRVQCIPPGSSYPGMMVIEFDADCNHDGIVDYGQILLGQLADDNHDGIPDVCQQPTCHDADLYTNGRIDGADLAALLSEWGPVTPLTHSDFNHDGRVDGADLAFLLSVWGPCSN